MILKTFEYYEFPNDDRYWAIKQFELGKINLFAAKNATGKSRTLMAIDSLDSIIQKSDFNSYSNYTVEFSNKETEFRYNLNYNGNKVISEKLEDNEIIYINRSGNGKGEILTAQSNKEMQLMEFQVPENKLVISRRDQIQYPYLEKIHKWAEGVQYYTFGKSMNQEYGIKIDKEWAFQYGNSDNPVEIFFAGEFNFKNKYREKVLEIVNEIGYNLKEVGIKQGLYSDLNIKSDYYTLYAIENNIKATITQNAMSQGMFRALSIIIHITYHVMMGLPTTILIDDIGEGLDFERSSKLIKLLIRLTEENDNIQLIMSTNDRFVMNNVPLEYWQVIQRTGGECRVYNYQNSKEKFDEFAYTGLNNFDFLATDFINSEWKKV